MIRWKPVLIALVLLFAVLQGRLWIGQGSIAELVSLGRQIEDYAHGNSEHLINSLWRSCPTLAPRRHARAGAHAATAANDAAAAAADAPSHNIYGAAASFTHNSASASVAITGASPLPRPRASAFATTTCFCIHRVTTVAARESRLGSARPRPGSARPQL